jgi:hypothetical protein
MTVRRRTAGTVAATLWIVFVGLRVEWPADATSPTVIDISVGSGSDDAEEAAGGSTKLSSSTLELVYDRSNQTVGLRFWGVQIPTGATISAAWVQFQTAEAKTAAALLRVEGQAADAPATFAKKTRDVSSRPRTASSVAWEPPPWSVVGERGSAQRTPDLSAVVQEIIDRPGWLLGNPMVLIVTGSGVRAAGSKNGGAPAALHVEYVVPVPNQAPVASAGADLSLTLPDGASLSGSVSDDGLPDPPGAMTSSWSVVNGPDAVSFADAGAVSTVATFSTPGDYVLRLSASDSAVTSSDEVLVSVLAAEVSPSPDPSPDASPGSVSPSPDPLPSPSDTASPSSSETSPPPPPPDASPDGFISSDEALARPGVVVYAGTRSTRLRVSAPPPDTTYDLRSFISTAYYADETAYPVAFGDESTPATGLIIVGGYVQGSNPLSWTWQDWKAAPVGDGAGFKVVANDAAIYDVRADDVFDFVRVRRPTAGSRYLVKGCYGTTVRDDSIENDQEADVIVRDCLFDGTSMGVSIGQAVKNPDGHTRIYDTTFVFKAFPNTNASDGYGHGVLFKQLGAGTVDLRNVTVCYPETPIGSDRLTRWMPGTYSNVTVVLGPDFTIEYPGTLPPGVSLSRDWSICDQARAGWLTTHA